ncbi:MAG: DNA repair exonuclease [Bacillota bacterium]|nr:DNA repair exonuclease [Bacillota bacterium]
MKLLHLSDCHFSVGFANKSREVRRALRESIRDSFRQAIDYTLLHELDLILIAGDLFDTNDVKSADGDFVLSQLRRATEAGIYVVYAAGNHDDRGVEAIVPEIRGLERFLLFSDGRVRSESITLRSGETVTLVGNGYSYEPVSAASYPRRGDGIHIGIAHMSIDTVSAPPTKVKYNANSLDSLRSLRYDYFALGHIHKRQMLTDRIAYSGSLQGLHINETGPKGGYLVELKSGGREIADIRITEVNFNGIVFEQSRIDLTGMESLRELRSAIKTHLRTLRAGYVRLQAGGTTALYSTLYRDGEQEWLDGIAEECGMIGLEFVLSDLRPEVDLVSKQSENTLLGIMLRRVEELTEFELRQLGYRADELGVQDLDELKAALRGEAVARLLEYEEVKR